MSHARVNVLLLLQCAMSVPPSAAAASTLLACLNLAVIACLIEDEKKDGLTSHPGSKHFFERRKEKTRVLLFKTSKMPSSSSEVNIRGSKDLDQSRVQAMMRAYFDTPDLTVKMSGKVGSQGGGANENYNSEIKRLSCVLKRGEGEEEEEELHMIIKVPPKGFIRKMHKIVVS